MVYGYCRISTPKQSLRRQVENILNAYPDAKIVTEIYTGAEFQGRERLATLVKKLKNDDTVVFDSASRMSRNSVEAMALYEDLYNRGVHLIFLKEPHINTEVYKSQCERQIDVLSHSTGSSATDQFINAIIAAINTYTIALAKTQVQIAFDQAEKELMDIRQRTKEGIRVARASGKQIGHKKGVSYKSKKEDPAKKKILKISAHFNGSCTNEEVMKLTGLSSKTFYKYLHELEEENPKSALSSKKKREVLNEEKEGTTDS